MGESTHEHKRHKCKYGEHICSECKWFKYGNIVCECDYWKRICKPDNDPYICPWFEIREARSVDKEKHEQIVNLCNEIEQILSEVYNTGSTLQNCDYDAIYNRLKEIKMHCQ